MQCRKLLKNNNTAFSFFLDHMTYVPHKPGLYTPLLAICNNKITICCIMIKGKNNVQEVEHFFNLQKYIPRRFIGCFASSLKLFLFSLVDSSLLSLLRIIHPIITNIYCQIVWIPFKVVFDNVECALYIVMIILKINKF